MLAEKCDSNENPPITTELCGVFWLLSRAPSLEAGASRFNAYSGVTASGSAS